MVQTSNKIEYVKNNIGTINLFKRTYTLQATVA